MTQVHTAIESAIEGIKTFKISPMGFFAHTYNTDSCQESAWDYFDEKTYHLKGDSQIDFAAGKVFLFF